METDEEWELCFTCNEFYEDTENKPWCPSCIATKDIYNTNIH